MVSRRVLERGYGQPVRRKEPASTGEVVVVPTLLEVRVESFRNLA